MFARAARPEGPERLPALRPAPPGRRALTPRPLALLLSALLAAGAIGACGGDDEPEAGATETLPELTVPQTDETEPPPSETETTPTEPTETVPPDTDGGTTAPETEPPADEPGNDAPPPEDSPAERFEEFCNENPGACG